MLTPYSTYCLPEIATTKSWGGKLATTIAKHRHFITQGIVIYLTGDLGSGKTTLLQGFFNGLGISETIQSPTFNFIHNYSISPIQAFHVDLYRLASPAAAVSLDLDVYCKKPNFILAIEWPEKGLPVIPEADIKINIHEHSQNEERTLTLFVANSSFIKIPEMLEENAQIRKNSSPEIDYGI